MDIQKMRIDNLKALVVKEGGASAMARKFDVDASYISQLLNGHRGFGERSARTIESKLKLNAGWLDQETHNEDDQPEISAIYNELNDEMKFTLMEFAKHLQEKNKKKADDNVLDKLYGHSKPVIFQKDKKLFIKN